MRPDIFTLLKTLRNGKGDFVPLMELGVHPKIKERFLGHPIQSLQDEVEFSYKAGYDYVKLQPIVDFNPQKLGAQTEEKPLDGTLSYNWAHEGQGLITSFDDLERYVFPRPEEIDYSRFEQIKQYLPEGMGVIGQYGDIFTMTWELMGMEAFSLALFENPELVKTLNSILGNIELSMFEYMVQSDVVDAIWYTDDIAFSTGLLVSPDVLHSYFFPWLKKIGEMAKAADKPFIYHTDGVLWDVFEDIIACGVNALHPIEPKAMNLAEVKQKYGDRLCLIGAVDVDLLCRGSKEEVEETVRHNIEVAAYNGGYCVGSGNSIPDYVNYENYLTLLNASKKYGTF